MPRHAVILNANEVRNHDPARAAEMVENLILKGDSTAPGGGAFDILGQIYLKAGDLLSARESFMKNLEVFPDAEGTFCYLGLIEDIAGNASKSREWYRKCPGREFDPEYADAIRSAYTQWQRSHPNAVSRISLLVAGTKPPSLAQKAEAEKPPALETCPKCGRKEPTLTAVIDSASMTQKLLCSQCARASIRPGSVGINMQNQGSATKWWQFWKK